MVFCRLWVFSCDEYCEDCADDYEHPAATHPRTFGQGETITEAPEPFPRASHEDSALFKTGKLIRRVTHAFLD